MLSKSLGLVFTVLSAFAQQQTLFTSATGAPTYANCAVVGDGVTDDTANVQNCINSLPDYHVLVFGSGSKMLITNTIKIYGRYGLRLTGVTSVFGGPSIGKDAPTFVWGGAAGGTMFDIECSQNWIIEGLTLFSDLNFKTGSEGAATGFNVDENTAVCSNPITTNGVFDNVSVLGMEQNPNFRAITFALNSNSNVENMRVRNSVISCSYGSQVGQGIVIGPSQNAFQHVYSDNKIASCGVGVYIAEGYANIIHNDFNLTTTDIYAYGPYGPVNVQDNNAENMVNFYLGSSGPTALRGNRIAGCTPPANTGCVSFTGGGTVTFEQNSVQGLAGSGIPISGEGWPYGAPALISRGNTFSGPNGSNLSATNALAGYKTFGYSQSIMGDSWPAGGSPLLLTMGGEPVPAIPGLNAIDNNKYQWVVLENGGSNSNPDVSPPPGYVDLIPRVGPQTPVCAYVGREWFNTADPNNTTFNVCLQVHGTLTWVKLAPIVRPIPVRE
jgi:hypothetical protein